MSGPELRSRYLGVMLGLAVGDALGAPVEFTSLDTILAERGDRGVTDFEPWSGFPAGYYTDDTQMSVATANGTLAAYDAGAMAEVDSALPHVYAAYLDWLETQSDPSQDRDAGATCLAALRSGVMGTTSRPINDRKGCGTIMRIAPCALLYPGESASDWAAACGAITHGHTTGWLAGAVFAQVLEDVLRGDTLEGATRRGLEVTKQAAGSEEVAAVLRRSLEMHTESIPAAERISAIGEGWMAEETLGIALSCALAHPSDYPTAVLAAVNMTGDSDSTASVTGALMGAMLGAEAIPAKWREGVENAGLLVELAERMWEARGAGND